jgi:hypothetical protein
MTAPAIAPEAPAVTPATKTVTWGVVADPVEPSKGDHHAAVDRQEHAQSHDEGAGGTGDQVADERDRDHDWLGG